MYKERQNDNELFQTRTEMPPEDILALQSALIKLALNVYPDETEYVDKVLSNTSEIFSSERFVLY